MKKVIPAPGPTASEEHGLLRIPVTRDSADGTESKVRIYSRKDKPTTVAATVPYPDYWFRVEK